MRVMLLSKWGFHPTAKIISKIRNNAVINENPTDKLIRELREENARLAAIIGGGDPDAQYQIQANQAEVVRTQLFIITGERGGIGGGGAQREMGAEGMVRDWGFNIVLCIAVFFFYIPSSRSFSSFAN